MADYYVLTYAAGRISSTPIPTDQALACTSIGSHKAILTCDVEKLTLYISAFWWIRSNVSMLHIVWCRAFSYCGHREIESVMNCNLDKKHTHGILQFH